MECRRRLSPPAAVSESRIDAESSAAARLSSHVIRRYSPAGLPECIARGRDLSVRKMAIPLHSSYLTAGRVRGADPDRPDRARQTQTDVTKCLARQTRTHPKGCPVVGALCRGLCLAVSLGFCRGGGSTQTKRLCRGSCDNPHIIIPLADTAGCQQLLSCAFERLSFGFLFVAVGDLPGITVLAP
jgi:hypothetical protein